MEKSYILILVSTPQVPGANLQKLPGEKTDGDDDSRLSVLLGGAKESLKCGMVLKDSHLEHIPSGTS